jgi:hypothetical protein
MKIFDALRGRPATNGTQPDAAQTDQATVPIDGYDRLGARQVVSQLHGCSQEGLAAIESHERAHKGRAPVLDKLRYLRGSEPLAGYDTLDSDGVSSALEDADLDTAKRVREYERKFQRRPSVLEAVTRTCTDRHTASSSISARRADPAPASDG